MVLEEFLQALTKGNSLPIDFSDRLLKELVVLRLPKNHHLIEAPRVPEFVFCIMEGLAVSYRFTDAGKKRIEHFWKPGQIILSRSFCDRIPSSEFLQLVEGSEVAHLSYDSVQRLFDHSLELFSIYRNVMQGYCDDQAERFDDLQLLNGVRRFEKLIRIFPGIEQLVPQEYIASYLSMTPQSLSRIKRGHRS